ncbi:MAG: hypothetical protein V9E90_01420 [Saprospiraceae bacterium]
MAIADSIIRSGTISKKQICDLLGLVYSSGRCANTVLNMRYFNDETLAQLGITRADLKKIRVFDKVQTQIIVSRFKLHFVRPALKVLLPKDS